MDAQAGFETMQRAHAGRRCYVAGDWGTSRLRLSLMDACTGNALASLHGPGIGRIEPGQATRVIDALVGQLSDTVIDSVLLCGMVGSSLGWVDTGYLDCPVSLEQLPQNLQAVSPHPGVQHFRRAAIMPGLHCTNPYSAPDYMRGEEVQMLGAVISEPRLREGRHLVCLPGTHCKWAWLEDGTVLGFTSAPSGELFAVLGKHSVLVANSGTGETDAAAFDAGVARSQQLPDADLLHLLFEARGRQLSGSIRPEQSRSWLSGLLIGRDVAAMTRLFTQFSAERRMTIIGCSTIAAHYHRAATHTGFTTLVLDGDELYRAAMHHIFRLSNG